jgi:hypothetical protein
MGLRESCKESVYTKRQRKRIQEEVIGKVTQWKASYFVVFRAVKSSAWWSMNSSIHAEGLELEVSHIQRGNFQAYCISSPFYLYAHSSHLSIWSYCISSFPGTWRFFVHTYTQQNTLHYVSARREASKYKENANAVKKQISTALMGFEPMIQAFEQWDRTRLGTVPPFPFPHLEHNVEFLSEIPWFRS